MEDIGKGLDGLGNGGVWFLKYDREGRRDDDRGLVDVYPLQIIKYLCHVLHTWHEHTRVYLPPTQHRAQRQAMPKRQMLRVVASLFIDG